MNDELIKTYNVAIEEFNKIYKKDGYYITSFLDFDSFNIYFHKLNVNKYLSIKILNNLLYDYSKQELIKIFEEVFFDEKENSLWIKDSDKE